jgi:hypothetical protein
VAPAHLLHGSVSCTLAPFLAPLGFNKLANQAAAIHDPGAGRASSLRRRAHQPLGAVPRCGGQRAWFHSCRIISFDFPTDNITYTYLHPKRSTLIARKPITVGTPAYKNGRPIYSLLF